jgi:hypothetical protein
VEVLEALLVDQLGVALVEEVLVVLENINLQ